MILGGHPRRLSVFEPFENTGNVLYLRNVSFLVFHQILIFKVSDYHRLTKACSENGTISIIGKIISYLISNGNFTLYFDFFRWWIPWIRTGILN